MSVAAELLRVDGLQAYYGRAQILFDVSLAVARGEVVALMGRNGAGKSTTFKALMGLLEHYLSTEQGRLIERGIRLRTIGRVEMLPAGTLARHM